MKNGTKNQKIGRDRTCAKTLRIIQMVFFVFSLKCQTVYLQLENWDVCVSCNSIPLHEVCLWTWASWSTSSLHLEVDICPFDGHFGENLVLKYWNINKHRPICFSQKRNQIILSYWQICTWFLLRNFVPLTPK